MVVMVMSMVVVITSIVAKIVRKGAVCWVAMVDMAHAGNIPSMGRGGRTK